MTTTFNLDADANYSPIGGTPRDLKVALPKGLVGAATATPTCSMRNVIDYTKPCPLDTAVGEVTATLSYAGLPFPFTLTELVFNVTPDPGEPAAFGFNALFPRPPWKRMCALTDYGITTSATNLTEAASIIGTTMTLWGSGGPQRPGTRRRHEHGPLVRRPGQRRASRVLHEPDRVLGDPADLVAGHRLLAEAR